MSNVESSKQDALTFELLKLLLQVAWADDDVAAEESQRLLSYAKAHSVSDDELRLLEQCLAGKAPLPAPNLGFLKTRRLEVLRAVKDLLTSDSHIAEEEEQILAQISDLLR